MRLQTVTKNPAFAGFNLLQYSTYSPIKYASIARAALIPAAIASPTIAGPVTQSPPAKTPARVVAPVSSSKILIKTSPLLDIQQGLSELKNVSHVYVVAIKNEVKELLFLCEKDFNEEPIIEAVNLFENKGPEILSFHTSDEKSTDISFGDPKRYLYEPNASILKAGAFKTVCKNFALLKVHPNTHLYTSDSLISNFPGRVFEIEAFVKPVKKDLLNYFPEGKANITTRNYPLSPEQLKKKTGLKDGGDKFLIGFSGEGKKFLVVGVRL